MPGSSPGMTSREGRGLLFLLRGALGGERLRSERVVGQPVPDLGAAEQRNAEIAAHFELLAVGAELHQRAVDRPVARIHDGSVLIAQPVALHSLDQCEPEHRGALLRSFAFFADPVLVFARLEEDLDDIAYVDAAAFRDLEPAFGLARALVDLLPQPDRGLLGGPNRNRSGAHRRDRGDRHQFERRQSHHILTRLYALTAGPAWPLALRASAPPVCGDRVW